MMRRPVRLLALVLAPPLAVFAYHPGVAQAATASCFAKAATIVVTASSPHTVNAHANTRAPVEGLRRTCRQKIAPVPSVTAESRIAEDVPANAMSWMPNTAKAAHTTAPIGNPR